MTLRAALHGESANLLTNFHRLASELEPLTRLLCVDRDAKVGGRPAPNLDDLVGKEAAAREAVRVSARRDERDAPPAAAAAAPAAQFDITDLFPDAAPGDAPFVG